MHILRSNIASSISSRLDENGHNKFRSDPTLSLVGMEWTKVTEVGGRAVARARMSGISSNYSEGRRGGLGWDEKVGRTVGRY